MDHKINLKLIDSEANRTASSDFWNIVNRPSKLQDNNLQQSYLPDNHGCAFLVFATQKLYDNLQE